MLLYIDSASLPLIDAAMKQYPADGVTTNPSILSRDTPEGISAGEQLRKIRALIPGKTLFVQVTSPSAEGMVRDGRAIAAALGENVSVKIPCTREGFLAMKALSAMRISVTATACFSPAQALLAAKSGASFAAPYVSRLDNLSQDGAALAGEMARLMTVQGLSTKILAASFRTAEQVTRCVSLGVPAVTVKPEMLDVLAAHPCSAEAGENFLRDWQGRFSKSIADLL